MKQTTNNTYHVFPPTRKSLAGRRSLVDVLLPRCLTPIFFLFVIFSLFTSLAPPPACASVQNDYQQAKKNFTALCANHKKNTDRQSWLRAVNQFRSIYDAEPENELAPSSLFMLARIYHDMYQRFNNPLDLGESIAYYEDIMSLFSRHRLADDSLYAIGQIYLTDKNDQKRATRTFAKLIALYPNGDMARIGAGQIEKLKSEARRKIAARTAKPLIIEAAPLKIKPGTINMAVAADRGQLARMLPLRHWSTNNYTRVVIETSSPVKYKEYLLEKDGNKPRRLYVDLAGCQIPANLQKSLSIQDGLLRRVRSGQYTLSDVRVVLDIQSLDDYKIFSLQDPSRIVIDVMGQKKNTTIARLKKTTAKSPADGPSLLRQLGLGIRRVVIDPGHGGKDTGAIGPRGLLEKDVVLKVAKKVAKKLKEELNCEVILTRNKDVFIPLEERTAIANTKGGDLFISIHANAEPSHRAKGVETYFLDLAKNKKSMRVAARENATSESKLSDLQKILMELIQNTKMQESVKLAEYVQENLATGLNLKYKDIDNHGVKQAPFIVLIGARMPSILAEIAFISHPKESKRLRKDEFLDDVAEELVAGVSDYVTDLNMANLGPGFQ